MPFLIYFLDSFVSQALLLSFFLSLMISVDLFIPVRRRSSLFLFNYYLYHSIIRKDSLRLSCLSLKRGSKTPS